MYIVHGINDTLFASLFIEYNLSTCPIYCVVIYLIMIVVLLKILVSCVHRTGY